MKIRPSIVLIREQKIMFLRYNYAGNDLYQFPGGNMEEVETLEQTLARELNEEVGLTVDIKNLLLTAQVINTQKKQATLHCLFLGESSQGAVPLLNKAESSAHEVVWMDIDKLDQLNLYPSVGKEIKEILQKNTSTPQYLGLIEQPWL